MIKHLSFYCQKVLPLVYDDSLSYYEVLCKVVDKINELVTIDNRIMESVEEEVKRIVNEWLESGKLEESIKEAILDLQSTVDNLTTKVNSLESRVNTVNSRVNDILKEKIPGTIICVGDSYLQGYTPEGTVENWGKLLADKLGKTMNTNFFNFAQGGSGFVLSTTNQTFYDVLYANRDRIPNRSDVQAVIIGGGYNDNAGAGGDAWNTAFTNIRTHIHDTYPNAKMYVVYFGRGTITKQVKSMVDTKYWYQSSNKYGFTYLGDGSTWLKQNDTMGSDGYHPNRTGQNNLAGFLYSALCSNTGDFCYPQHLISPGRNSVIEYVVNGQYVLNNFGNITVSGTASTQMLTDGNTKFGSIDISNSVFRFPSFYYYTFSVMGYMYTQSDGIYQLCNIMGRLENDKINLYLYGLKRDGKNFIQVTGDYSIYVPHFQFRCSIGEIS